MDIVSKSEDIVFGACTEVQSRDGFADRVDGQPQPSRRDDAAHTGEKFIELKHGEREIAKQAIVPALRMVAHAIEPASDGGIGVSE